MSAATNSSNNGGIILDEIVDVHALAAKLRGKATPLCVYLMEKFSQSGRDAVDRNGESPEKLKPLLAEEFSRVIRGASVYHKTRFADIPLSLMTQGVLARKPHGLDEVWLNRLLLRDAFRDELAREANSLAAEWVAGGINFRVYCEERHLARGIGISFKIVFKTSKKWDSRHAKSLEQAKNRLKDLADEILSGSAPTNKRDAKERDAKAEAYDAVTREVAKTGKIGKENVLEFVTDAVKAQVELGPTRPLLRFVHKAVEVMPTLVHRLLLQAAFLRYKAFHDTRQGVGRKEKQKKLNLVERFVTEIPACEKLAERLVRENRLTGDREKDDSTIRQFVADGLTPEKPATREGKPPEMWADDVTPLGILVWLRWLGVEWKSRRDALGHVRNFFVHLRDVLHAVPQVPKTVADHVPRPKREGKKQPVAILWFADVWRILINLQDLESVFFVALGVFAGLHETEILRLIWRDIRWKDEEPHQICIPSGKGKDPQGAREGKYVDVRFPLNKILLLGAGRTGRIVTNNKTWQTKLRPLVKRLKIVWKQSIMRHTCASYLNGIGVPLEDVARQLRDRVSTVELYYILQLSKPEAEPLWTLPVDPSVFDKLPSRLRFWDWRAPLKPFPSLKTDAADSLADAGSNATGGSPASPVDESAGNIGAATETLESARSGMPNRKKADLCPLGESVVDGAFGAFSTAVTTETGSLQAKVSSTPKRRKLRYPWPPDLEFLTWLWEHPQQEIAQKLGCRQTSVSSHARTRGLDAPDSEYWRRKKLGLDVEVPEEVKQARLSLKDAAHAAEAAMTREFHNPSRPPAPGWMPTQKQNPPTEGLRTGSAIECQESSPNSNS